MPSTIVSRTQSGAESAAGRRTWTFSCWFKKDRGNGSGVNLFQADSNGAATNNYNVIDFNSSDQLDFNGYESGSVFRKITNRQFRDTNAWYHLVIAFDTTQSTADDRIKIYINGVRETSFGTSTNPAQDYQGKVNAQNKVHAFGRSTSSYQWGGVLSHVHLTEGTAYAPTVFGSTDATTGEWKINTSPSVSYGTNGFFLFKNDNSVNNQAGNSSGNFAVTAGTLSKTEDSPSNVFATFNSLIPLRGTPTYQSGNTYFRSDYNNWDSALSTIGATSGKWYFEAKWGNQDNLMIGCVDVDKDPEFLSGGHTYGYVGYRGISYFGETSNPRVIGNNNNDLVTGLTTFASGDIIGCAIDLDNREMFVHRNGTYTNSGNPATRANPYNMATSINQGGTVLMGVASRSGYGIEVNFGNGYFSSTAISSAGTNASNLGIFEYDVPSGYTALCTKGLNE